MVYRFRRLLCSLWFLLATLATPGVAWTQLVPPAQVPLLRPALSPVKPNVVITLDDSGSMDLAYLPDGVGYVGAWTFNYPWGNSSMLVFTPEESGLGAGLPVVPAERTSRFWLERVFRSPDTNALYYNPEVRYQPWLRADGSRYPPGKIEAALLDPNGTTSVTANLAVNQSQLEARWCDVKINWQCPPKRKNYSPGLYYRLQRSRGNYSDPTLPQSYTAYDANAPEGIARGPARTDCAGPICTQTEEQQNFANWFVYHRTRLLLAKAALGEVLGRLPDQTRLGYGSLSGRRNDVDQLGPFGMIKSGVRDFDFQRKQEVLRWLYGIRATGATPLREAIQEVGRYFEVSDSRGPWGETPGRSSGVRQASCRRSYHVLITDGYWSPSSTIPLTLVGNRDGSPGPRIQGPDGTTWAYAPSAPYEDRFENTLADLALHYWYRDLRPDLPNQVPPRPDNEAFWQSVSQLIVGLGVRGTLDPASDLLALKEGKKTWSEDRIDDLWHAALNSRGAYFSAKDPAGLFQALRAALVDLAPEGGSQAGIAASSPTTEGWTVFAPTYRSSDWSGDLRAYGRDATGRTTGERWSAERALPPWSERRLFTWDDDAQTPAAVRFAWPDLPARLRAAIGPPHQALVDYVRGDRTLEGSGLARPRGGLLGDFINSNAVVAGGTGDDTLAALPEIGKTYRDYLQRVKAVRPPVVYIGSNAGVLHAFQVGQGPGGSTAGRELFGYIPRATLEQLSAQTAPDYATDPARHRYLVDGPLREVDVFVRPPGGSTPGWRNYLLGTTGAGPAAVFALDITDPTALGAQTPRWELRANKESHLGHVLAPVATGLLPNGKWVALFGNGYGSRSGQGALFVVDLETGAAQTVALPPRVEANGLGGVAVRKDSQGRVIALYAGDLLGQLWRFDFDPQATAFFTLAAGGQPLFAAPPGQAIVQAPVLHRRGASVLVLFGTGRLITLDDAQTTTQQAIYVVEDRLGDSLPRPLRTTHLVPRTLGTLAGPDAKADGALLTVQGNEVHWTDARGWFLPVGADPGGTALRLTQPLIALTPAQDLVLVTLEAPSRVTDPCDPSAAGTGLNLVLPVVSGLPLKHALLDTDGDGVISSQDQVAAMGYGTVADGADVVVRIPAPYVRTPSAPTSPPSGPQAAAASCMRNVLVASASRAVRVCAGATGELKDRVWRRVLRSPF